VAALEFDDALEDARLAFIRDGGHDAFGACGIFWLGGYRSDMRGSKAESLSNLASATRRQLTRFDYSGHGESSGNFTDGTISDWLEQSTHMFLQHAKGKRIIVGSSMGGWLALLLARRLREEDPSAFRRIAGMVLLAPATDMTQDLMWDEFDDAARQELRKTNVYMRHSAYGEPYPITVKLLADGEKHLLLRDKLYLPFPVRILQGSDDVDVPVPHAIKTFDALTGPDITITAIKGGDHRLSTASQLRLLQETVLNLAKRADGETF
jgi:pimeloyl-ACP methyl ester carboxylesterase